MAKIKGTFVTSLEAAPDSEIDEGAIRAALDGISLATLRPILAIGSISYGVLGAGYILFQSVKSPLSIVASCTAGAMLGFWILLRLWHLPSRWAHPALALLACTALFNSLYVLHLSGDPHQATTLLLLIIASGSLFLSTTWLQSVILVTLFGWTAVTWEYGFSSEWLHFGLTLTAATALSLFIHWVRVRIYTRLEGLRLRDAARANELRGALALADEARRKAVAARQNVEEASRALQESEKKFRQLAESPFEAILVHDGREVLEANQTVATMFGYEPSEAAKMKIEDFFIPGTREAVQSNIQAGREGPYSAFGLKKDGTVFPVEVLSKPIPHQGRNLRVKAIRDLTERKRAEETLKAREELARTLVEELPQRIFFKDQDSIFVFANSRFSRDLGLAPEELVGKSDYDFHPHELAEKYRADDRRIMEARRAQTLEEINVVNGRERLVEVTKVPVIGANGEVRGILGVFTDITERRRVEDAVKASEEKFRVLFESSPDAILVSGLNHAVIDANPAASRLTGFAIEQLTGMRIADIVPPERRDEVVGKLRRVAEEGPLFSDGACLRSDGTVLPLEVSARRIEYGDQEGILLHIHDITDRKRSMVALRQAEE
ncbi:MAG TPA: PAS domain S-box protein [Acidobacteriota bacterium]|nr:PAS domain S-box protein [Acidobacteriota bacterium]